MSATLEVTHKAVGAEVRRDAFDVLVDGNRVGAVKMNKSFEITIEPGRHTVQIRDGRKSSKAQTFEAAAGDTIAYRCTGKRFLPLFLLSFVVPSLALVLKRE